MDSTLMQPLYDVFCSAGGCTRGYKMAGFEYVVGIDNKKQPRYVGDEFIQMDALEFLRRYLDGEYPKACMFHASPPCQRWSLGTQDRERHPDLIQPVRELLEQTGVPYVIENVPHAPIRADIVICGCQVGLPMIRRVRHFEVSVPIFCLLPPCHHDGPVITVTGNGTTSGNRLTWGRNISIREMRAAMDIDWMPMKSLSQAIPPAYTNFIGKHLIEMVVTA